MAKLDTGFSLIELMVVIAIVTLLAAIAVPAYKDYVLRAKIQSLQGVADKFNKEILTYFYSNDINHYPNATELGIGTTSDIVDNPQNIVPIASRILVGDSTGCASDGYTVIEVSPDNFLGGSSSFFFECDMFHQTNGIIKTECFYEAYDANGDLIQDPHYYSGWYNSGADGWAHWQDMVDAAVCQR